jgi:hypothetical protein
MFDTFAEIGGNPLANILQALAFFLRKKKIVSLVIVMGWVQPLTNSKSHSIPNQS